MYQLLAILFAPSALSFAFIGIVQLNAAYQGE
jgi:hypothetical protein